MLIPLLDEASEAATRTGQAQDSAAGPADAGCCLYGDGTYASRSNVAACGDRGVDSRIKLRVNSTARGKGTGDAWGITVRKQLGGYAGSHVWRMSDYERRRFREEWKKEGRVRQEVAGGDRALCIQADVRRALVLAQVEEHGAGSQDQGGHVQQAGRHGAGAVWSKNMQGLCMFQASRGNYVTHYL